jgi:hypothetical protein
MEQQGLTRRDLEEIIGTRIAEVLNRTVALQRLYCLFQHNDDRLPVGEMQGAHAGVVQLKHPVEHIKGHVKKQHRVSPISPTTLRRNKTFLSKSASILLAKRSTDCRDRGADFPYEAGKVPFAHVELFGPILDL